MIAAGVCSKNFKQVMKIISITVIVLLSLLTSSCTYLKYNSIQSDYARIQQANPSQVNLKHMLDRETFFVIGRTIDHSNKYPELSMVVVAYSSEFEQNERVDTMYFDRAGTHFGLNLPPGFYNLIVFADLNRDGFFTRQEAIGSREIKLGFEESPQKIVSQIDIKLGLTEIGFEPEPLIVQQKQITTKSVVYPEGTIRTLNDSLFDANIATLGMYDPASFLEYAPTMFYALEEDQAHKIPVIFVHGIDGSPRSFSTIVNSLDRDTYRPWFFYYPSGGDLEQLADLFYNLFLSGEVIPLGDMPMIVVAHSMGGLVVRQSLNRYGNNSDENKIKLFVSIASPLGGHPSAKSAVENGLMVLPAWRDLDPNSRFIRDLYDRPLPNGIEHHLFYAYDNPKALKIGENSDGVVPLSSQLHQQAQQQSTRQYGFKSGHLAVLENPELIEILLTTMDEVHSSFPEVHMEILKNAGLKLELDETYDPKTRQLLSYAGRYLAMLVSGAIQPFHSDQEHFVHAVRGEVKANNIIEKDFIRLIRDFPDVIRGD